MENHCYQCKFFYPADTVNEGYAECTPDEISEFQEKNEGYEYWCRRFPPVCVRLRNDDTDTDSDWQYPITYLFSWCGEFMKKEIRQEEKT